MQIFTHSGIIWINVKNCRFITTCKAHNWHIKKAEILFGTSRALDIIHSSYYIHGPWCAKRIFAVLYVSVMGLTRCYKTTVFYIYICSFSTKFILQMYIIAQTYLRCCGVATTNGSHTGILHAVSIWLSSSLTRHSLTQSNYFCLLVPSNWKIASEFTRKIMEQILTVQYTA